MTSLYQRSRLQTGDEATLSRYLAEISAIPLLDRKDELELARKAARGDTQARETIVKSNLRFVVKVAKRYRNQGLPFTDLISEGNVGLMRAVEKFDVGKGCHFITYAVWWIRQAILKAIYEKSRMIRLPYNKIGDLARINRARHQVDRHGAVQPTAEGIANKIGMDPKKVIDLVAVAHTPVSLESPVGGLEDGSALRDYVEDARYENPEDSAEGQMLRSVIEGALRTLTHREADILRCRFGLAGRKPMTLREVGERHNVTKERIRQIQNKAIERIRDSSGSEHLRSYLS